MAKTMAVLLLGSSSTIIEYDIENAVGQAFENVAKMVKWELEQEQDNDEKIDNVDHHQV
jgi:flavin-binding protein dodecin